VAKETSSQALESEATHLRSDLLSSAGVLLGLVLVWLTRQPRLDPAVAAVVTTGGGAPGLQLPPEALPPPPDERLPEEEGAPLPAGREADPRVRGYHGLRPRRAG